VYDIGLHVAWCPKYRRQVLTGPVAVRLRELIDAKAAEHEWRIAACEVMPDHVHLFAKTRPKDSPAFVANFRAETLRLCLRSESISSGPRIPSGKPGKFSTSVVCQFKSPLKRQKLSGESCSWTPGTPASPATSAARNACARGRLARSAPCTAAWTPMSTAHGT